MKRRQISMADRQFILWLYDYKCANCDSTEWLEVDHIVPLAKGGEDHVQNMQCLCSKCNLRKGDNHQGILIYDKVKNNENFHSAIMEFIFGNKEKANDLLSDVLNNNDQAVRLAILKATEIR